MFTSYDFFLSFPNDFDGSSGWVIKSAASWQCESTNRGKGKVFYGQEPPMQWRMYCHRMWGLLLTNCSNVNEIATMGTPSFIRLHPATDNGVRDGRSNWLAVTQNSTQGSTTWAPCIAHCKWCPQITRLASASGTERSAYGILGQRTACAVTRGIIIEVQ